MKYARTLIVLVFVGCATSEKGSSFPEVVGTWEWVRSEGGYVGDTVWPGGARGLLGTEVLIQFANDGTYREAVDGRTSEMVFVVDTTHAIKFGGNSLLPALSSDTLWWFSRFAPLVDTVVIEWQADTLLLTPAGWSDSYTHYFKSVEASKFPQGERP